ncbi:hypothetical protein SSS_04283 [Sarcoptes scabiei]|nr:hypothetical protein SSS_04283 [Sarcoptes scabiei]
MLPGSHTGQTLNDRINAARYALAGQGLARVVCKATTEELIAPKKKHIDYLLQCTEEPNVSIPQLANLLIERTQHTSWIVVFKALITVHHLMCYGNERFTQYLASSNCNFQLNNYIDKNAPKGYDMSIFIRRYARYINAKALSYRTVAFDFTKVQRGEHGQLRQMCIEKLLKTIPVLQSQIDSLLEFDCNATDLSNGVINASFLLLFKDLIRLFACYNDGIITCLEKYFEITNKKLARETLDLYKKFLVCMNKVGEFLKVAEIIGIDRGEMLDLTKAPSSLLEAMEQHLAAMEGRKIGSSTNGDKKQSEETIVKKAIEEEERILNKLKEKHLQEKKVKNPFLAQSTPSPNKSSAKNLANESIESPTAKDSSKSKNSDDILDLFMDSNASIEKKTQNDLFSSSSSQPSTIDNSNPFADLLGSLNLGKDNVSQTKSTNLASNTEFTTSDGFASAFGSSSNSNLTFDAFGDVLQPQNVSSNVNSNSNDNLLFNSNMTSLFSNEINHTVTTKDKITTTATSTSTSSSTVTTSSSGLIKGDLDAALASLAQNLEINGFNKTPGNFKKGFNSNQKIAWKTSGGNAASGNSLPTSTSLSGSSISPSMNMMVSSGSNISWNTNQSLGQSSKIDWAVKQSPMPMLNQNTLNLHQTMIVPQFPPNSASDGQLSSLNSLSSQTTSSATIGNFFNQNKTAEPSSTNDPFNVI